MSTVHETPPERATDVELAARLAALDTENRRLREQLRTFLAARSGAERVYISPWAYSRSMLMILWGALRHPSRDTTIDLTTGRIVSHTTD